MIRMILMLFCFLFPALPLSAQQTIDNCPILPYTRCPGVDLQGANLAGANLQGAYLKGAKLQNADLSGAVLIDAYLYDADLRGAKLDGANLSKAVWTDGRVCAFDSIGTCK
ncbi:Pentapeptide repeat-containing protein [Desulfonatronum thiosulfatophilum]|uniref:Pentapeptide repeat-containing protein n=1 Tax=Desulfonatronum thiosulfatophilum TaxID=617002 RepID=A0A1G6BD67_9BACT|nr:pentapeptide repeat-containing protein [Desulfonatronum thiosulfatophilum]SDB18543.1 Pentapeptide repeat-containing protein [Desulfonatronum thiosulfatophilum]